MLKKILILVSLLSITAYIAVAQNYPINLTLKYNNAKSLCEGSLSDPTMTEDKKAACSVFLKSIEKYYNNGTLTDEILAKELALLKQKIYSEALPVLNQIGNDYPDSLNNMIIKQQKESLNNILNNPNVPADIKNMAKTEIGNLPETLANNKKEYNKAKQDEAQERAAWEKKREEVAERTKNVMFKVKNTYNGKEYRGIIYNGKYYYAPDDTLIIHTDKPNTRIKIRYNNLYEAGMRACDINSEWADGQEVSELISYYQNSSDYALPTAYLLPFATNYKYNKNGKCIFSYEHYKCITANTHYRKSSELVDFGSGVTDYRGNLDVGGAVCRITSVLKIKYDKQGRVAEVKIAPPGL